MSLRGLDVIIGALSPEEKARENRNMYTSIVANVVGAIVGAIVSVALIRRVR